MGTPQSQARGARPGRVWQRRTPSANKIHYTTLVDTEGVVGPPEQARRARPGRDWRRRALLAIDSPRKGPQCE